MLWNIDFYIYAFDSHTINLETQKLMKLLNRALLLYTENLYFYLNIINTGQYDHRQSSAEW